MERILMITRYSKQCPPSCVTTMLTSTWYNQVNSTASGYDQVHSTDSLRVHSTDCLRVLSVETQHWWFKNIMITPNCISQCNKGNKFVTTLSPQCLQPLQQEGLLLYLVLFQVRYKLTDNLQNNCTLKWGWGFNQILRRVTFIKVWGSNLRSTEGWKIRTIP